MSNLIVLTIVLPLMLGLIAGGIGMSLRRFSWVSWLLAASLVGVLYVLLEGIPPLPPISSKHKLGWLLIAIIVLTPFAQRLARTQLALLSVIVLGGGLAWMGSNKLLAAAAWPGSLWLVPLALLLAVSVALPDPSRSAPDRVFANRLGLLLSAIAGAAVALIGGFVGLGQLLGSLAAAMGGFLIIAYGFVLSGRTQWLDQDLRAAHWLLGSALASMVLITACFAPSPDPVALYLVALPPLATRLVPTLGGVRATLKPFIFGFAAAVPALAAIALAYSNSLTGLPS